MHKIDIEIEEGTTSVLQLCFILLCLPNFHYCHQKLKKIQNYNKRRLTACTFLRPDTHNKQSILCSPHPGPSMNHSGTINTKYLQRVKTPTRSLIQLQKWGCHKDELSPKRHIMLLAHYTLVMCGGYSSGANNMWFYIIFKTITLIMTILCETQTLREQLHTAS